MSVSQTLAEILNQHVNFELECIDRMYLNIYVPAWQCEPGVVKFFRSHRGHPFASQRLRAWVVQYRTTEKTLQ